LEREKEKRQREEEASKATIVEMYDEVKAAIEADALAAQRSTEIRSRPPTKSQLKNLMMRYLNNMGGYKYSQLKAKTFEEFQGLYERQKRVIDDFKPMDSYDAVEKEKVLEEPDNTKIEVKEEGDKENIRKRSGRRLKIKATKKSKRQKTDSDLKKEELLKTFLQIVPDEEGEVNYEVLDKRFPIINWEFDKMDLEELYNLVMQRFETTSPEEEWILKSWNCYEKCGVHTLTLEDDTEIYMLAERRFIQKQIDESGSHDGSEKDPAPCYCNEALAIPEKTTTGKITVVILVRDRCPHRKAISPFQNVQAYNVVANKPSIPPQDPTTLPTILTSSLVLPPSPLFDPRHFFVPEELLPPKNQIHPPSSSSTTLSNSSRKQACILVSPSFSTYTPTPPQIYELEKSSMKMHAKHHEKQFESILSYLEELSFHYIEKTDLSEQLPTY
nr:hypothetical protein [Tanacetum cinerariifolium]